MSEEAKKEEVDTPDSYYEGGQHPDPNRWWTYRRKGMFIGIKWAIIQTLAWIALGVYDKDIVSALTAVIGWSYGISALLIVGYYSNTAVEEYARNGLSRR